MNSARPALYTAYYQPKNYGFEDVVASVKTARDAELYTMINYLVFPGITDQEEEIDALKGVVNKTGVNFIHMKNLNIDPHLYMKTLPTSDSRTVGMKRMTEIIRKELPDVKLGYFNQPVR